MRKLLLPPDLFHTRGTMLDHAEAPPCLHRCSRDRFASRDRQGAEAQPCGSDSVHGDLLAGVNGLDNVLRRFHLAKLLGDVLALDQTHNVGEHARLNAGRTARREEQEDQLGVLDWSSRE
jgi:hypothetical protein